jgi:ferredoxin
VTVGNLVERRIGDLTIRIDRATCIGTGNCMKLAPEVFDFDAETICTFRDPPGDIERDRLIEACHVCPVDALIVIDPAGRQLVA